MSDEYLIRDAIVGKPTDAEKSAAVAALGDLLDRLATAERDLAEARAEVNMMRADLAWCVGRIDQAEGEIPAFLRRYYPVRGGQPT